MRSPKLWEVAEELAAEHMRALGFVDARRTGAGVDKGIDVIASAGVAQVKLLSSPVGAPDVQRFRGAAHGFASALFYSWSGYTSSARAAADQTEIALFNMTADGTVTAVNEAAQTLRPPSEGSEADRRRAAILDRCRPLRLQAHCWDSVLRLGADNEGDHFRNPCEPGELVILAGRKITNDQADAIRSFRNEARRLALAALGIVQGVDDSRIADWAETLLIEEPGLSESDAYKKLPRPRLSDLADRSMAAKRDLLALASEVLRIAPNEVVSLHVSRTARVAVRDRPDDFGLDPDVFPLV